MLTHFLPSPLQNLLWYENSAPKNTIGLREYCCFYLRALLYKIIWKYFVSYVNDVVFPNVSVNNGENWTWIVTFFTIHLLDSLSFQEDQRTRVSSSEAYLSMRCCKAFRQHFKLLYCCFILLDCIVARLLDNVHIEVFVNFNDAWAAHKSHQTSHQTSHQIQFPSGNRLRVLPLTTWVLSLLLLLLLQASFNWRFSVTDIWDPPNRWSSDQSSKSTSSTAAKKLGKVLKSSQAE